MKQLYLLNVIKEILEDKESTIYWDESNYKKISSNNTVETEKELEFVPDNNKQGIVTKITVGTKKLNINLKVLFEGNVINTKSKLKMDAKLHKEYCLVRNGLLHLEKLTTVLSNNLKLKYNAANLILTEQKFVDKEILVLDLTKLSIVDLSLLNIDKTELGIEIFQLEVLKVKQTVLKRLLREEIQKSRYINHLYCDVNNIESSHRKEFNISERNLYST